MKVLSPQSADGERAQGRRLSYRRRRRVLFVVLFLALVAAAVAANQGPIRAYYEARVRVEETKTAVAALEEKKTELQTELGRLTEASYLETLAREELAYARPGEELYVVTETGELGEAESGAADAGIQTSNITGDAAGSSNGEGSASDSFEPGFFERLVRTFLDLF